MSTQKQFDFKRAAKLRALERVVCSSRVKSLLKALDGFARDDRTCTVTIKRIGVSIGVSPKTAQRYAREAEGVGLLEVTGSSKDGQARTYRILWGVVFDLPDGVSGQRLERPTETPVNCDATPGHFDRGPRSSCPPTPVTVDQGPRSTVTGVYPTDSIDKVNATVRQAIQTVGGGDEVEKKKKETPPRSDNRQPTTDNCPRPPGWWAGKITRDDLRDRTFVVWLYGMAQRSQIIRPCHENQVRIVAVCLQAAADESLASVSGWVISTIEGGWWNRLSKDSIRVAIDKCKLPLTDEQRATLRDVEPFQH